MEGFSWVVERPAVQASVGPGHGTSHDAGEAFFKAKSVVFLKLYKRNGLESSGKEPDVESDASGATASEKVDASKGKKPALEASGKSASAATDPALVFQADKEGFLWSDAPPCAS